MSPRKSFKKISPHTAIPNYGDLQHNEALSSRTGKLWIEYIKVVRILFLFLRAERSGDWDMHLYCIAKMIPVLHAGGHSANMQSHPDFTWIKWISWRQKWAQKNLQSTHHKDIGPFVEVTVSGLEISQTKPSSKYWWIYGQVSLYFHRNCCSRNRQRRPCNWTGRVSCWLTGKNLAEE